MNPLIIYFLKVNIAIALFYLFYKLFFANDTLWKARRIYLIFSILLSATYPLFSIVDLLESNEPVVNILTEYVMLQEVVITPAQTIDYGMILTAIYGIVALLLLIRLFIRLISILIIKKQGKTVNIQGVNVHSFDKEMAPFSFFGTIYMNPALHNEKETKEILTHELTHVQQWHSADVLFAELLTIVCWINPAAWLMKREIRQNLEYLADDQVLSAGFDSRSYQYHLLQLSYQTPDYKLTNQFNISPLKKRITMMNQKKTPKAGMLKYLMIAPLALALVVTSNAESLYSKMMISGDRNDNATIEMSIPELQQLQVQKPLKEEITISESEAVTDMTLEANATSETENEVITEDDPVFVVVETMPVFPGGDEALMNFLRNNTKYPVKAQEAGTQGRVICQFVIGTDGSVTDIKVVRSVDPLLDAEAMRVISLMPKWTPGQQRGKNVRVMYTMPVNFRLQGKTTDKPTATEENTKAETNLASEIHVVGYGAAEKDAAAEPKIDPNAEETIFQVVEKMPTYPGGDEALFAYLSASVRYPVEAQKKGIQGRVICQFVVNRDGSIVEAKIVRSVDPYLDAEALRVINFMPKWTPGMQKGKPVRVKYTMPINFRLQ